MKIFTVKLMIDETDLAEARRMYAVEHNGRMPSSDKVAVARDLDHYAYGIGGMPGSFEVVAVEDGGDFPAV